MAIERSSGKHGRLLDEEMKKEIEGELRAGRPTRAEEWRDAEAVEDVDGNTPVENAPSEDELTEDGPTERPRGTEAERRLNLTASSRSGLGQLVERSHPAVFLSGP